MKQKHYLAIDNGASGGKAVLGAFDGKRFHLQEIYRYSNQMIYVSGHYHWDILRLFRKIEETLTICAHKYTANLDGVGLDNWGVDFGLLARDGTLLSNPYTYRDKKNEMVFDEVFNYISREEIYKITGIQILHYNPLFQLFSLVKIKSPLLDIANKLLFIGDIFNYFLTNKQVAEFSLASGSQLYDNNKYCWSEKIFTTLGLPFNIVPEIVDPGTILGELLKVVKEKTGIISAKVIAPLTHDTGSAVTAVPIEDSDWAFLSSGTWSTIGTVEEKPLITPLSFKYNFTNEGGLYRSVRFLKNITGLWLLDQCKTEWEKEGATLSYKQLIELAQQSPPFKCILNPDDPSFFNPLHMPYAIQEYCKKTGQPTPETKGEIVRSILESLALIYRKRLETLEEIKNTKIKGLHIVGGGSRNTLLNQFITDCIQRPVITGPIEATSTGNIIVQAIADGTIGSFQEAHEIIRKSVEINKYEPSRATKSQWENAYEKFLKLTAED